MVFQHCPASETRRSLATHRQDFPFMNSSRCVRRVFIILSRGRIDEPVAGWISLECLDTGLRWVRTGSVWHTQHTWHAISSHSWYFDPKNQRFIYGVLVRAFGSDKGNRCVLPALHVFSTLVAACARSRGTASWRRQGMDHVGRTSGPGNVDFSLVL